MNVNVIVHVRDTLGFTIIGMHLLVEISTGLFTIRDNMVCVCLRVHVNLAQVFIIMVFISKGVISVLGVMSCAWICRGRAICFGICSIPGTIIVVFDCVFIVAENVANAVCY